MKVIHVIFPLAIVFVAPVNFFTKAPSGFVTGAEDH